MRILYFTRDYSPHDHRFLSALEKSGNEIKFLRFERLGKQVEDQPVPSGVDQVLWRFGSAPARWQNGLGFVLALKKVIHQVQPDIIHAGPIQKPAFLTALTGYHPLVSMSWGSDMLVDADRNRIWQWATRYTLNRTDILVGDCQAVARKAISLGFPSERIVLFPWGVDLDHFQPGTGEQFRKRLDWENAFVILSLRSWEQLYGVDHLLSGFVKAARRVPELRLLLLGNGSQAANLHNILMQAGMLDRVFFGGQISQHELPRFYHAADLYISASHSDGSSVSLMEALACGLPVLVSDIPGNLEWITNGEQGWLFPDGNEDAICEGILKAYQQRKKLKKMRAASRQTAEARADWTKNFERLLEAYEMALQRGKKYG